jgi:hypothetical protein
LHISYFLRITPEVLDVYEVIETGAYGAIVNSEFYGAALSENGLISTS